MDGSRIPSPRIHPLCAKAPEELVALTRAAWDSDAYRIAPGPFLFEGRRLSWGPRACTETWRCRGPVRARLTLVPMTVHVGFIEGEGLRVRGRTLPAAAMAVTVG